MATAKVVSLHAQPSRVSFLAFEVGGILDTRRAKLGDGVKDIPYQKLCDFVKAAGSVAGDPSRLKADAAGTIDLVRDFSLASLRNEDRKASLDSAVNSRQNIFFSKHANAAAVISTIRAYYSRASAASKVNRLVTLADIAQEQAMALQQAYEEDDRLGVVKETTSSIDSHTRSNGASSRTGIFSQHSVPRTVPANTPMPFIMPMPPESYASKLRFKSNHPSQTALTVGMNYETSDNWGVASGGQSATHMDYEYKTPYLEARARNNRAQISLMDQRFESYMFEQNVPHLERIFKNELASIDNDVYQLQIALLRSFLISPLDGIVTGIYKHPGDAVSAGEPVMRIEDNRVVHLVGIVVSYDPIAIGAAATVTATLRGGANPPTTLTGHVVAARGHASSGRWEVVVQADNVDGAGQPIVPLNYWFDPEFTEVTVA